MDVFKDFRGREPTTDALLRQGGLMGAGVKAGSEAGAEAGSEAGSASS